MARERMGKTYTEADKEKKGKTLYVATRVAKDRKAFQIWLIQPDA
jgi:lipopolysaccharide/colanic/teichoic acid biosynthesis glycosyltransferase